MGHGSAGDGVGHWWAQRFSALLLIGLTVWLIWALTRLAGADYSSAAAFLGSPFNATMAILFMVAGFYHGQLGLQVIIEDYVHRRVAEVRSEERRVGKVCRWRWLGSQCSDEGGEVGGSGGCVVR